VIGLLALFTCLASISVNAQQISGKVIDDTGEGLIGVSVLVEGTTSGTVTDIDGNFTVEAPSDAVLVFSYVGFETQSVPVNGQSNINLTLGSDTELLDEVVVVGYGTVKKSDVTGSVSSVKSEEIQAFPVLNAGQALQGRAAGVAVQTQNGGEPGAGISIRVRGSSSLNASSDPLVVVDGFVGASFPQQNDIESIEPYGQGPDDIDWQDVIYRDGYTQNHQMSVSGGSESVSYYISGTYFDQEGIVINSDFDKIQFLANVDAKIGDRLKIGLNSVASRSEQNGVSTQSTGRDAIGSVNGGGDDVVALAFRFSPDAGYFNSEGNFSQNTVGDDIENPWAVATQITNNTKTDNARNNLYADLKIVNGLNFKTTTLSRKRLCFLLEERF